MNLILGFFLFLLVVALNAADFFETDSDSDEDANPVDIVKHLIEKGEQLIKSVDDKDNVLIFTQYLEEVKGALESFYDFTQEIEDFVVNNFGKEKLIINDHVMYCSILLEYSLKFVDSMLEQENNKEWHLNYGIIKTELNGIHETIKHIKEKALEMFTAFKKNAFNEEMLNKSLKTFQLELVSSSFMNKIKNVMRNIAIISDA